MCCCCGLLIQLFSLYWCILEIFHDAIVYKTCGILNLINFVQRGLLFVIAYIFIFSTLVKAESAYFSWGIYYLQLDVMCLLKKLYCPHNNNNNNNNSPYWTSENVIGRVQVAIAGLDLRLSSWFTVFSDVTQRERVLAGEPPLLLFCSGEYCLSCVHITSKISR